MSIDMDAAWFDTWLHNNRPGAWESLKAARESGALTEAECMNEVRHIEWSAKKDWLKVAPLFQDGRDSQFNLIEPRPPREDFSNISDAGSW